VIDEKDLEQAERVFVPPERSFDGFLRLRDRKRRNRRIAAGVVGIAVFVAAVWLVTSGGPLDRTQTPARPGGSESVPGAPNDYVIDLDTGELWRLPKAIVRTLGGSLQSGDYAVSPGGNRLAYVGLGRDGNPQIFVSGRSPGGSPGIAGTGVRQMTHDPGGAMSPAWSPDGTRIAYVRTSSLGRGSLFVLVVATGELTALGVVGSEPQFMPDGSSILYTGGTDAEPTLMTVPVAGGEGTRLIEPGPGLTDAGNGSISPDGSLVTYLGSGSPQAPDGSPLTYQGREITHAGPGRFLSNVDGTGFRFLPGHLSNPAGTWSPDGSRIVTGTGYPNGGIWVIDIANGEREQAARGRMAIWLDDHTLLVEV
jgi:Tol biopolymer transport system component